MCPSNSDEQIRVIRTGARVLVIALLFGVGHGARAHAQSDVVTDGVEERDDGGSDGAPVQGNQLDDESRPWVDGVPHQTRLRAHRSFLHGNVLIKEGLFARAAVHYRDALALWDHPIFHYNLAIAQINLDQPIGAYQSFQRALRYGGRAIGQDRSEQARSFRTLLRNQLARVEVTCDEPGAQVTLDGKPLFVGPGRRKLMALPGGHQLMADKIGRMPDTRQIVLAPGQRARFSLAPQLPEQLVTERRWPAWRPWAVTGVGLAAVAAGAVFDSRAAAAFDRFNGEAERRCTRTSGCDAAAITAPLRAQRGQAERMQTTARAIYLAGGTVLAGGAVLVYLNRERPVRRGGEGTARISVVPVLGPDAAGMSAHTRF